MSMNKIEIILGPPGTGKTTTLLDLVDTYLSQKVSPDKIGFISFTRKSVNEAKDRAAKRFIKDPNWFTYFRTIHSLAFRQLGISTGDVLNRKHYRILGNELGLKMTCMIRKDMVVYEMSKGDQVVFIESLSRLCCEKLKYTWNRLNPDVSYEELDLFSRSLRAYKKSNLLIDFTDMLTRYYKEGYKPKLKVLFIDEAQDLCPLQWRIVEQLIDNSEKVYIAGDDDQAIFRWSGADVDYFINLAKIRYNKVNILHQSYRLPRVIYNLANQISSQIEVRNDKKFKPTNIKGSVIYCNSLDDIDLDQETWLILVRNAFIAPDILSYVHISGYSYEGFGDSPKDSESLKAALWWEKLRKGAEITVKEARITLSYASKSKVRGNVSKALMGRTESTRVSMTQLTKWCRIAGPEEIWHEALDKISPEDREYYIAARRKGESLVGLPRIKISTIHGAKGGEAENVILYTDMSARTYRGMLEHMDDEARVFYVGVTRALKRLYIIQPRTPYYFTL